MLTPQKFILIYIYEINGSFEKEVLPINEINRETIHNKIKSNMEISKNTFTLWNHEFDVKGIQNNGYNIYTIDEFFAGH